MKPLSRESKTGILNIPVHREPAIPADRNPLVCVAA
jgi:hypothetical protein